MRILEIISGRGINGVSKHVVDVAIELRQRGHEVSILGFPSAWILETASQLGFPIMVSDMHRWPTDELRRVAGFIRENRIDVIHTHMSKAHFFGVLLRWYGKVPSVATAHSCHFQPHWMANNFVIAVSDATRRYHQRFNWVPRSRIKTIHNSIHMPASVSVEDRASCRNKVRLNLGLDSTDYVIGVIGRVSPQKGQLTMMQAMPAIVERLPNAKLLLIGGFETPDYLAQIEQLVEQHQLQKHVQILGLREDVLELLYGIDLLAQPSLWESFPISMLEGMAAGVPIVASDVGGVRECIEHNQSGCLVPPKNPDELSKAILRLASASDLCGRLVMEAKRIVRMQFAPEIQGARIEDVLASVCTRRPTRIKRFFRVSSLTFWEK